MVNAIEGELLFARGMHLSLADAVEVYVLPPAFATPGAAVTMPLRRDELTGYDCVWVEPISMDATLRDEFRGWSRCTFVTLSMHFCGGSIWRSPVYYNQG